MKLKTLFKTLISLNVRRTVRSLIHNPIISKKRKKHSHNNNKTFFGSFRFHYNWCSSKRHSHVLPVPAPVFDGLPSNDESHHYYDATWHSAIPTSGRYNNYADEQGHNNNNNNNNIANGNASAHHESQLYGYLEWLEEKRVHGKACGGDDRDPTAEVDDIDKLADLFIANRHAQFILEKQESARRFKEMLERSA